MNDILKQIVEQWYLSEPALFHLYCMQQMVENTQMQCVVRCGKGRVEWNPSLTAQENINSTKLEELLRVEMIRLFLKHPYERQPEGSLPESLSISSSMVIDQHYNLRFVECPKASEFQLPRGECYEWYVNKLNVLLRQPSMQNEDNNNHFQKLGSDNSDDDNSFPQDDSSNEGTGNKRDEEGVNSQTETNLSDENSSSNDEQQESDFASKVEQQQNDGNGDKPILTDKERQRFADNAELWEDNEFQREEINEIIRQTTQWGSIPGNMVEKILASLVVKMDYRKVLSSFHTSILSSKRHLTRMRPNRRSGFLQMGSRYDLMSRLLVAVDVSGSIDSKTLQAFYSVVARFFKYGIETIDVVQFDVGLREIVTFKKRLTEIEVNGRGGTEFQSIFNYIKEHRNYYDGLLIFTDGYAEPPKVDFATRTKVLWICRSECEYKKHVEWMKETGKVCWIEF